MYRLGIQVVLALLLLIGGACADAMDTIYRESSEYLRQKNYVLALAGFRDILKARPQHVGAAIRAAYCFEKVNQPSLANRYYRQALEYDPTNAIAREGLRRTLENSTRETVVPSEAVNIRIYSTEEQQTEDSGRAPRRLYINRRGLIYTMLQDGRDVRKLSAVVFGLIQPPRKDFGFLSAMESTEDREDGESERDLFYFDAGTGQFHALSRSREDEFSPRHHQGMVYFLRKGGERTCLMQAALDAKSDEMANATTVAAELGTVSDFQLAEDGLFINAQLAQDRPFATYFMPYGQSPQVFSQGLIHHESTILSDASDAVAVRTRDGGGRYNFLMLRRTNQWRTPLLTQAVDELAGTFSSDGSRFYYSASTVAGKDGWDTVLGEFDLAGGTHRILWKHNFLNRNLMMDEDGLWLYFTTNYDNNFEVYRIRLSDLERERLTVSDEDEVQLGRWTLSTW